MMKMNTKFEEAENLAMVRGLPKRESSRVIYVGPRSKSLERKKNIENLLLKVTKLLSEFSKTDVLLDFIVDSNITNRNIKKKGEQLLYLLYKSSRVIALGDPSLKVDILFSRKVMVEVSGESSSRNNKAWRDFTLLEKNGSVRYIKKDYGDDSKKFSVICKLNVAVKKKKFVNIKKKSLPKSIRSAEGMK